MLTRTQADAASRDGAAMPGGAPFEVAEGPVCLDAALIVAEGGLATSIAAFEVVL